MTARSPQTGDHSRRFRQHEPKPYFRRHECVRPECRNDSALVAGWVVLGLWDDQSDHRDRLQPTEYEKHDAEHQKATSLEIANPRDVDARDAALKG